MNSTHLTTDELDAFLTESPPDSAASHVATCAVCAGLVERDRRLVAEMAALAHFAPAPGFGDQVMARVAIANAAAAVAAQVIETPRSVAARRRAIGALLVASGGIAAGFIWASAHPADALRWSSPALQHAGHTLWVSLQTIVANGTEQPWFATVRDALATPTRALGVMVGIAGAYAIGLLGLRRLMSEPATNASW